MSWIRRLAFFYAICFILTSGIFITPVAAKPEKPSWGFWDYANTLNPLPYINPFGEGREFLNFGAYTRTGEGSDYFGINHLWWDAKDWDNAAKDSEAWLQQTSKTGDLDNLAGDARYAVTVREYAIGRYQKDNANGKNDRAISDGYRSLAQTYTALGPAYSDWRLEELQHATEVDSSNYNAWNDRIQALEGLGRTDEAAEIKHQRDLAIEASASRASSFLPISLIIPILAITLLMLGHGLLQKKRRPETR